MIPLCARLRLDSPIINSTLTARLPCQSREGSRSSLNLDARLVHPTCVAVPCIEEFPHALLCPRRHEFHNICRIHSRRCVWRVCQACMLSMPNGRAGRLCARFPGPGLRPYYLQHRAWPHAWPLCGHCDVQRLMLLLLP